MGKKNLVETRDWHDQWIVPDKRVKKFLGRWWGKKPELAFPCQLPGKPGKKNYSWGDWEFLPAVGFIVLALLVCVFCVCCFFSQTHITPFKNLTALCRSWCWSQGRIVPHLNCQDSGWPLHANSMVQGEIRFFVYHLFLFIFPIMTHGLSPGQTQADPRPYKQLRLQYLQAWALQSQALAGAFRPSQASTSLWEQGACSKPNFLSTYDISFHWLFHPSYLHSIALLITSWQFFYLSYYVI